MSLFRAMLATMGGPRVSIGDANISDHTAAPTNASAAYQLTSAGVINEQTVNGGTVSLGNWIYPTIAAGSNYEVKATLNSGTLTSGTTGSWLSLGSSRLWSVDRTTNGSSTVSLTIEIRRASDGTVLDTAAVTLVAERSL